METVTVFTVHPGRAEPARVISLADAGLKERADLQEWVRAHPEILGSDVRIVTFEFSGWQSRSGSEADRLDLLGIDAAGHLVVAELKRGVAPDTVEMQAIPCRAPTGADLSGGYQSSTPAPLWVPERVEVLGIRPLVERLVG